MSNNGVKGLLERIGQSKAGTWVILNILSPIDPYLLKWTSGLISSGRLVGFPSLLLTTTGAKSGLPRPVTINFFTEDERLIVVASNGGQPKHPAWYHNLKANPQAEVTLHGRSGTYTAHEATGDERARLWERARQYYSGFDTYEKRAEGRTIPVMVLTPLKE